MFPLNISLHLGDNLFLRYESVLLFIILCICRTHYIYDDQIEIPKLVP